MQTTTHPEHSKVANHSVLQPYPVVVASTVSTRGPEISSRDLRDTKEIAVDYDHERTATKQLKGQLEGCRTKAMMATPWWTDSNNLADTSNDLVEIWFWLMTASTATWAVINKPDRLKNDGGGGGGGSPESDWRRGRVAWDLVQKGRRIPGTRQRRVAWNLIEWFVRCRRRSLGDEERGGRLGWGWGERGIGMKWGRWFLRYLWLLGKRNIREDSET